MTILFCAIGAVFFASGASGRPAAFNIAGCVVGVIAAIEIAWLAASRLRWRIEVERTGVQIHTLLACSSYLAKDIEGVEVRSGRPRGFPVSEIVIHIRFRDDPIVLTETQKAPLVVHDDTTGKTVELKQILIEYFGTPSQRKGGADV